MKKVIAEAQCRMCKEVHQLEVTQEGIEKYQQGEYIQKCFPNLNADQRELLISGTCGTCFDKMFAE